VEIRTTLDQRIQSSAEDALAWILENKVREGSEAEAAIVVMSADGAVRAMVGGRNPTVSGAFNRATQARRQTGSSFKPFIYAAALELDFSPLDIIDDRETCWNIVGSGEWCPQNYDRKFKGPVTLTQALAESRNLPAVILSEDVGREVVRTVANGFGIESDLASGPALALGVSESTLIEMTGAYAGILNGGSSVAPYGLVELRLQGDEEPFMTQAGGIGERVIREHAARELTWMMTQVIETGTGGRAKIDGWDIAGKSGTTQAARDAWFIAFTGDYVTGIWMGYDDNRPLSGVTGGGLPADIWRETMTRVLAGRPPTILPMQVPQGAGSQIEGPTGEPGSDAIRDVLEGILGGAGN
jgi:membrane peptidoglycan carboxypeptidase